MLWERSEMTTLVVEVPDNKSDFLYNLIKEFPFANIYKKDENISFNELLKEGYIVSSKSDIELSNEFIYSDLENLE
jgi:hypothetical protein